MNQIDHLNRFQLEAAIEALESKLEDVTAEKDKLRAAVNASLDVLRREGPQGHLAAYSRLHDVVTYLDKGKDANLTPQQRMWKRRRERWAAWKAGQR